MPGYNTANVEQDLEELEERLRAWHESGELYSESRTESGYRKTERNFWEGRLESIIFGVKPERMVQLIVGNKAVEAFNILKRRNNREAIALSSELVMPGQTLNLQTACGYNFVPHRNGVVEDFELFVGDYDGPKVASPQLAMTLSQKGRLTIVEAPEPIVQNPLVPVEAPVEVPQA